MSRHTSKALTWANRVAALLFLLSAAIQLNDPDPLGWVAIYVAAAVACLAYERISPPWLVPALVGGVALLWAAYLSPAALPDLRLGDLVRKMEDEKPTVELGREMLGLVIIAAWMAVVVVSTLRGRGAGSTQ